MTPDVPERAMKPPLRAAAVATFGEITLTVRGSCLAPAVGDGETVRLVAARRQPPRFGDLVLVETAHGPRLHRLVFHVPGIVALTSPDRGPCDAAVAPSFLLAVAPGYRRPGQAVRSLLQGLLGTVRARRIRR